MFFANPRYRTLARPKICFITKNKVNFRQDFRLGPIAGPLGLTQGPMAMSFRLHETLGSGDMALNEVTLPRDVGKHSAMWRYWALVISMHAASHVLTGLSWIITSVSADPVTYAIALHTFAESIQIH